MNIIETGIEGLLILEPTVFEDERGYFFESYHYQKLKDKNFDVNFLQDNEAKSSYGVLRGLHYQIKPHPQAKLVRIVEGEVLDVVVDIREGSLTYGKHFSIKLSAKNKKQLFVPHGFAHGYVVLSDTAIFSYKCDDYYYKEYESGIRYDDAAFNIDWIVPKDKIQVSAKDANQPKFGEHKKFI